MLKLALVVSICLIPGSKDAIGKAAYLGAIVTVFGHPGRRFGQMAEALILTVSGVVLGVAWSTLGVYLGSLVFNDYPPAAYAIRGFFLAVVALFHGFMRSRTPRLFLFVLLMIIVSVVSLTSPAKKVTAVTVTQILYPILIGTGCIIIINVCIFPEFSSKFLGQMTVDTLNDTAKALESAGHFFIETGSSSSSKEDVKTSPDNSSEEDSKSVTTGKSKDSGKRADHSQAASLYQRFLTFFHHHASPPQNGKGRKRETQAGTSPPQVARLSIKELTDAKAKIRKKFGDCKAAQQECNFELAVSVLPPRDLKPLSVTAMKRLVAHTVAVISACESKFALLGVGEDTEKPHESKEALNAGSSEGDDDSVDPRYSSLSSGQIGTTKLVDEDRNNKTLNGKLGKNKAELEMIRPKREIEFGDARLLQYLLRQVAKPYEDLHRVSARAVDVVIATVACTYVSPHTSRV